MDIGDIFHHGRIGVPTGANSQTTGKALLEKGLGSRPHTAPEGRKGEDQEPGRDIRTLDGHLQSWSLTYPGGADDALRREE